MSRNVKEYIQENTYNRITYNRVIKTIHKIK